MKVAMAFDLISGAFRAGRMAQAYMIAGPIDGGGRDLADRILCMLFCVDEAAACGRCSGCRRVLEGGHPDALRIEPTTRSRRIDVEQVREIQGLVFQSAYEGGWKVCVLVGADRMTDSAANAFLKTLEEPPPRTLFLLLTDSPQFLSETILSRCQTVHLDAEAVALPGEWDAAFRELLSASVREDGVIEALARAERVVGLLKEMKATALAAEKEKARAGGAEISGESMKETLDARANALYRELRTTLMRLLLHWHRDVMALCWGGEPDLAFYSDRLEDLRVAAGRIGRGKAVRNVLTVEAMNRRMEQNLSDKLVLSEGFLELRGA